MKKSRYAYKWRHKSLKFYFGLGIDILFILEANFDIFKIMIQQENELMPVMVQNVFLH
jgi:hypothetical protein